MCRALRKPLLHHCSPVGVHLVLVIEIHCSDPVATIINTAGVDIQKACTLCFSANVKVPVTFTGCHCAIVMVPIWKEKNGKLATNDTISMHISSPPTKIWQHPPEKVTRESSAALWPPPLEIPALSPPSQSRHCCKQLQCPYLASSFISSCFLTCPGNIFLQLLFPVDLSSIPFPFAFSPHYMRDSTPPSHAVRRAKTLLVITALAPTLYVGHTGHLCLYKPFCTYV